MENNSIDNSSGSSLSTSAYVQVYFPHVRLFHAYKSTLTSARIHAADDTPDSFYIAVYMHVNCGNARE